MKYLVFIIAVMLVLPVSGQRKGKDDAVTPAYREGVIYALPRTGLHIKVQAVKETFQPGPYAAYAEQLLGIKNVKTKASVNWLIEEVNMETFAEPDPDQVHKALGEVASNVNLAPDGCIAGIHASPIPVTAKKLQTNQVGQTISVADADYFQYFTDSPLYSAGDSTNNYRPVKLPDEQKISKAAQRILECRRLQYEMAAGLADELPPDGEAYKASLKELKKTEEDYMSLFVGKYKTAKKTFGFDYIPKNDGKSEAVFRISEENGIVPASDLSGKPVMIEFDVEKELNQKYTEQAKSENPAAGESGVYYRIPGKATIRLIHDMNVISTSRATIAQFGTVAPVPENLLLGGHAIVFDPETGVISNILKNQ
jgi:hypothetical protein